MYPALDTPLNKKANNGQKRWLGEKRNMDVSMYIWSQKINNLIKYFYIKFNLIN